MRTEDKYRLIQNWTYLESNLEADTVVEHCLQKDIISFIDRERIMGERSRPDRALKLLKIVMCKEGDKVFDKLMLTLEDAGQAYLCQKLQTTPVPEHVHQDVSQEHILEGLLRECLVEDKEKECSVQQLFEILRLQLRRRQHYDVRFRQADIFNMLRTIFTFTKLRKNKRKKTVAVMNCTIKPELLQFAETNDNDNEGCSVQAVPVEKVSCGEVVQELRHQLELGEDDVSLADRLGEEDINGKALVHLTENHLEKLFPDLKMGQRIRFMEYIKATIEELRKPPEVAVQEKKPETPQKMEIYRPFDCRVKAVDVYEKGHILPEEQSRPGYLLNPVHKYQAAENGRISTLAEEAIQFAAACMNDRMNGTIHFGVVGKYGNVTGSKPGEIVGIQVDKQQYEVAITEEIYRTFYEEQIEMALQCIRDPVYIPVVEKDEASAQLFVVEIDVVPHSTVVLKEAFFLNPSPKDKTKAPVLLRYIDGAPTEVTGKECVEFMKAKERQSKLREETEKNSRPQPAPKPDLHRKLHHLLTDGNDYEVTDIFPLVFLSPVGNMTEEDMPDNFTCIKSLEPFCVFDFDPPTSGLTGDSHCLYNVLENQLGQVYEILTTDNFDRDSQENKTCDKKDTVGKLLDRLAGSSFRPWIFCNGYGPLEKEELKPAPWRSQRGQGFKEAVRFYHERIPCDNARILVFLLSRNYDVLLGALEEIFVKFPEQWILIAESEKIAQELLAEVVRRGYVEKDILEERCVIGMPWSHVNQSILKICGKKSNNGCTLPSSTGSPCLMKERDRNSLPDLEILSATQCSDENFVKQGNIEEMEKKKRISQEEFYRGKQVSWWNFYFEDHVLRRSQFNNFQKLVRSKLNGEIPDDERVAVVTVCHQPGAGGSTTARQLLWELRDEFRCCVIKQISDPRQTCDQITNLRNFEEPESPNPPLVLIDNEDEEKVFQLCSYMNERARREARDCRGKQKMFCVLVICIRMTAFPKKKDESKMTLSHELQPEEAQWFRTKYETLEERYKKKQLGLHPRLLISFNIIKENFNPDYIRRTVEEFISEIKKFDEKRLLKFVALINSFDPDFQSIPMSCFNAIMNPGGRASKSKPQLGRKRFTSGNTNWEASLSPALNVLLNRTHKQCMGGDIKAVRIINNNLSREILNNLCQREKQKVSDVILEFLHTDVFLRKNESSVQAQLIKIMKDILKKRAPFKKGREKFSPIILEIGREEGFDQAAEVLKVGFDRFDDPMIAQQIARIYIHCSNWKAADEFARAAQDMKPWNSYLCDTHGQVYKEQLIGRWKECFENEEQLEGEKATELIDIAFKAIEIFRREQKLSDDDCATGYNNCGFFSELRALVTLLDCCRFLKAFKMDKGGMLHTFLVDERYIPDGLLEELGEDRIKQLKNLYHEYEKPMRRLEDEQIQLKEDSCYQYSPGYSSSIRNRRMFIHLQECLDTYFGEDDDKVPSAISGEEACEFRRRRVKRKGGNSLFSIYELKNHETAVEELRGIHSIIEQNVYSEFCNTFDLKTIINVTIARISRNKMCTHEITLERVLAWTHQLYDKSKQDVLPYLEAYLYLVMFNWPTEWRNNQRFEVFPCFKIKEVIKEWKEAFQTAHPAQKEEESNKPDRRKGTTLFFLGQGEGYDEIVFYNELQGFNRRHIGDSIWDSKVALERLKRLKGTLLHGGNEMSVTLISQSGSATQLFIPTSYPIKDHSLWQKNVRFVLGFCWSGPKAFSVTRDDSKVDLRSVHTPFNFTATCSKRYDNSQQKQLSEQAVAKFWKNYFNNQTELEKVEKDLRLCTMKKQRKTLEQRKKALEKDKEILLLKRTSVLQGPD